MCAECDILQLTCALWWTNCVLETLVLKCLKLTFGISVLTFLLYSFADALSDLSLKICE